MSLTDQDRIETAADNCEVLRARLAKYEDAEGNPLAGVGGVDERAAFEAWRLEKFCGGTERLKKCSNAPDVYFYTAEQEAWKVWQARAALSAPSHGEQVRVLGYDGWRQAVDNVSAYAHLYNSGFGIIHEIRAEYARLLAAAPSAGSQEQG